MVLGLILLKLSLHRVHAGFQHRWRPSTVSGKQHTAMDVPRDALADPRGQGNGDTFQVALLRLAEQAKRPVDLRAGLERSTFLPNLPRWLVVTGFWHPPPPRAFEPT